MPAEGYLLPRNYLLGFVPLLLLCVCCQNKQSCWRIKAKPAVQHRGLNSLGFERETSKGGGGGKRILLDASAKSCLSVPIKTQIFRFYSRPSLPLWSLVTTEINFALRKLLCPLPYFMTCKSTPLLPPLPRPPLAKSV